MEQSGEFKHFEQSFQHKIVKNKDQEPMKGGDDFVNERVSTQY